MTDTIKHWFRCNFCGLKFRKKIPKSFEVTCPKCGEMDVELL